MVHQDGSIGFVVGMGGMGLGIGVDLLDLHAGDCVQLFEEIVGCGQLAVSLALFF